jgi:Domain of unknown function (DUF4189)
MRRCREDNSRCRVAVRFDKCGTYATSQTHYGFDWGNTQRAVQMMALNECGSNSCVAVSECE